MPCIYRHRYIIYTLIGQGPGFHAEIYFFEDCLMSMNLQHEHSRFGKSNRSQGMGQAAVEVEWAEEDDEHRIAVQPGQSLIS